MLVNGEEATLLDDVTEAARPNDVVGIAYDDGPDTAKVKDINGLA